MTIIESMHQHRSIREYTAEPIPAETMTRILEAGMRASSSGNMNAYSIIVTQDAELRKQLYTSHMEQSMVLDAPALITFCADFNRMNHWLRLNDAPPSFDNFMSFMVAAIDTTLVSQNVALAAEAEGLGICYLGSTLANCDKIGEILNLPPGVFPVVGFTVGYPAEDPDPRDRLPLDGILHYETYQPYTDEKILETYDYRNEYGWNRYMSTPRLREMIEGSGVENLAQVYTILKYTREKNKVFSQTVLDYLKQQEFMDN